MDKHLEKELKEKLLAEKERLEKELSEFATKDPKVKGDWDAKFPNYGDMNSNQDENSDEVEEYAADVALEHTLELRLKDIDDALEKMEKGTYGKCEKCGGEIPPERLKANPEARTCLEHAD
jgi:RNA polymerase-binding transcription factor DksA